MPKTTLRPALALHSLVSRDSPAKRPEPAAARTAAHFRDRLQIRAAVDHGEPGKLGTRNNPHARLPAFGFRVELNRESRKRATAHQGERGGTFGEIGPHVERTRCVDQRRFLCNDQGRVVLQVYLDGAHFTECAGLDRSRKSGEMSP